MTIENCLLESFVFDNNYIIEKKIYNDCFQKAYLAIDKDLDKKVILKVFENSRDKVFKESESLVSSLLSVKHENLAIIHSFSNFENKPYISTEYVEGQSLALFLKSGGILDFNLTIKIMRLICKALHELHINNFFHGEINPNNIMISSDNSIKLINYSLLNNNYNNDKLNLKGRNIEDFIYLPPEKITNPLETTVQTDLYSLGVIVYKIITGLPPFKITNPIDFITKALTFVPESIISFNPDIPSNFSKIVGTLLNKDPENRFESVFELNSLLDPFFEGLDDSFDISFNDSNLKINNLVERDNKLKEKSNVKLDNFLGDIEQGDFILFDQSSLNFNQLWLNLILEDWNTIETNLTLSQLKDKISSPDISGNLFSGVVFIDNSVYLFIYEGYFIGSIDTKESLFDDFVFPNLPQKPDSIILKQTNIKSLPIILSNLITGKGSLLQKNLNSSTINLAPFVESLINEYSDFTGYFICELLDKSECKITSYFIFSYVNGKHVFTLYKDINSPPKLTNDNINHIVESENCFLSIYKPKLIPLDENMKSVNYVVDYLNENKQFSDKNDLYNSSDISLENLGIIKEKISISINSNYSGKLVYKKQQIDLFKDVYNSIKYKFCKWLLTDFYFSINLSNSVSNFKNIYLNIPKVDCFKFAYTFYDFEVDYSFDISAFGADNSFPLYLIDFNINNKISHLENFIEQAILLKKVSQKEKNKAIFGSFYVSETPFSNDFIDAYHKIIKDKSGLLNKEKGVIKTGFNEGFKLILVQYDKAEKAFKIIAPKLID